MNAPYDAVMTLLLLVLGHFAVDIVLQPDTVAREKDYHSTTPLQRAVPWYYWLTGHAAAHGVAVALVTGSAGLGWAEFVAHWVIDLLKCAGVTNIHQDQLAHVLCKLAWWLVVSYHHL